ncbi:type VII toxin-antitoxin system MntA family adenylyltransferase antitoxin [Thiosulfativibrio zosterae]|uniref:Polymerase beta nucleotidyltransferase domain-containing protein n=1 Tax=Thiosulfativibrio zosterae TaxID=2675053 RepID=A0A6F8PL77_9GAMM|nr:nucleotidyltransferase domain-containing protein [Thiosulfativibrio zosterae]BBP42828.1 hypothetical protein THMIRHAT_05740 [Thiosulfativibrio zosterae]
MKKLELDSALAWILNHYPSTQAVYLFGSAVTDTLTAQSDLDLALLLPAEQVLAQHELMRSALQVQLESHYGSVDLISLRQVSTVFQHEIVQTGSVIFVAESFGQTALDKFELTVAARYRKLNEERAEIIQEGLATGFYPVKL